MCKNIVNIMLNNKLPENTVDIIMKCHGGVDAWLPKDAIEKVPDDLKELIRKDNFEITFRQCYDPDDRCEIFDKYFELNVDKSIIQNIIDKCVMVNYVYKGRTKFIGGLEYIDIIKGNYIWTTAHQCLCLDKFLYLKIMILLDADEDDLL